MKPARAADLIPFATAENAPASCTGRAVSVRRGSAVPPAGSMAAGRPGSAVPLAAGMAVGRPGRATRSGATILIVGPGAWPAAGHPITAVAACGFKAVISSDLSDFYRYNLIKMAMLAVCVDREAVAALQAAVESDPGILLTVDFGRREVRARGFVARFEIGGGAEDMAQRLRIAQRLLGSAALAGDARIRLQRRLVAICDALKTPGADMARSARRLDVLLTDLALTRRAGQARGGTAVFPGPGSAQNSRFP